MTSGRFRRGSRVGEHARQYADVRGRMCRRRRVCGSRGTVRRGRPAGGGTCGCGRRRPAA